jgi:hypothetical protein
MKSEELADKMLERIEDLKDQIDQKQEEVAKLATSTNSFDIGQITRLCDHVDILCCQIEILQEFVDLAILPDICHLSDEQLN